MEPALCALTGQYADLFRQYIDGGARFVRASEARFCTRFQREAVVLGVASARCGERALGLTQHEGRTVEVEQHACGKILQIGGLVGSVRAFAGRSLLQHPKRLGSVASVQRVFGQREAAEELRERVFRLSQLEGDGRRVRPLFLEYVEVAPSRGGDNVSGIERVALRKHRGGVIELADVGQQEAEI